MAELASIADHPNYDPAPDFEPLVTKTEIARHFGMSTRWVELRMREGLPCERLRRTVRFRLSDVEAWWREERRA